MMGPGDRFVVVSYDFEYSTEEGKRVWMKEGEVLLLLSKTNNDWWQVIRRGDRRPFYAPARYVAELTSDGTDWDSAFQEDGIHYRPDNGEPLPTRIDPYQDKKNQFSTFLGGGANKRSSYAPPPTHHGPPSADFLFGQPRFQERYRSNSMDSLLVQDINRQIFKPKQTNNMHLEKRPTFDNIDKRASWSHDKSQYPSRSSYPMYNNSVLAPVIQSNPGYHSVHPNLHPSNPLHPANGLHPNLHPSNGLPALHPNLHHPSNGLPVIHPGIPLGHGHKKPIPLPRSKIPVPTPKSATVDRLGSGQPPAPHELRTFKRSKTDLSLGMISQYKANRATGGIYSPPDLRQQGGSISSSGSHGRSGGSVLSAGSSAGGRSRSKTSRGGSPAKSSHGGSSSGSQTGSGNNLSKSSGGQNSVKPNLAAVKSGYGSKGNQRRQSTSRPNAVRPPGPVILEENTQSLKNDLRQKESLHIQENARKKRSVAEEGGPAPLVSPPKPALASKPSVPVIKSSLLDKESRDTRDKEAKDRDRERERERRRNLRAQSDTDILNKINAELRLQPDFKINQPTGPNQTLAHAAADPTFKSSGSSQTDPNFKPAAGTKFNDSANPHFLDSPREKDTDDELKISLKVEGFERISQNQNGRTLDPPDLTREIPTDRTLSYDQVDGKDRLDRRSKESDRSSDRIDRLSVGRLNKSLDDRPSQERSESKENLNPTTGQKQTNKKFRNLKETSDKFLDMEPLPDPPPTPPRTSPINIPGGEPLVISTEPMSTSSSGHNKSEDKSNCSSSFDSLDGSLDSTGWPDGGDWLGTEPNRGSLVSPNNSTCSRAPSSPIPGATPVRIVFTDWGEYLDTSGRKFYYNTKTREKSWKPPRRVRRSSDGGQSAPTEGGYSAPTSPDPYTENGDSAFEMSPGLSETETRSVEDETIHPTKSARSSPEKSARTSVDKSAAVLAGTLSGVTSLDTLSTKDTALSKKDTALSTQNTTPSTQNTVQSIKDAAQSSKDATSSTKDVSKTDKSDETPDEWPPSGYEIKLEPDTREQYFVNIFTGVAWYSALDKTGRTYYYEENGNQSCWQLPNVSQTFQDHSLNASPVPDSDRQRRLAAELETNTVHKRHLAPELDNTTTETRPTNLKIGDVSIVVVKQGALFKTRLEERGKKYRKNWSLMNLVLTDTFLLFYKDAKAFNNLQSGTSHKPDQVIDLKGAQISWCNTDKSKRSNVFELDTLLDQKLLLQDDDFTVANDWFSRIENVIVGLGGGETSPLHLSARASLVPTTDSASSTLNTKKSKISRTKSLKLLTSSKDAAAATGGPDSPNVVSTPLVKEKLKIREKLLKFFLRRPNVEDLMKRGIIKNEPVFGSTLTLLAKADHSDVPMFVKKCIQIIESKPEYLSTDGVYRQSGNLSTVQRLRLQVDHGNPAVLENVDDIHVLTGALKLFFRELKEPLIPWDAVERLMAVCNLPSNKAKVKGLKEVVHKLTAPHQATLIALLRHLDKVTTYKEVNRMAVSNLAIVFGPTLMWPPAHLTNTNMALNMMQQNMIVEALITNLQSIH